MGSLYLMGCASPMQTDNSPQGLALAQMRRDFLQLCDLACEELDKEFSPFLEVYRVSSDPRTHHMPFFEDAYAIWALCVAFDLTGRTRYLHTCRHWADRVIALQNRMFPKGAYYMNYAREPGSEQGDSYVADCGSIAMGILATSIRANHAAGKLRYLDSVKAWAKLVMENYVGKSGGITNGIWGYTAEWWGSTATAGALLFRLHAETALPEYLDAASRASDWMAMQGLRGAVNPSFEQDAPSVVYYCGQLYGMTLHPLVLAASQVSAAEAQIAEAIKWLAQNQKGRGAASNVDYFYDTYMAGMPYLMYVFAAGMPQAPDLRAAADEELHYIAALLFRDGLPDATQLKTWELISWAMMSYAARLRPHDLIRNSGGATKS
jgi:hypothetical protein